MERTKTELIREIQREILSSDIAGCITGSSMLNENFDAWDEQPDVDIFVYSEPAFTYALAWIENNLNPLLYSQADVVKREEYLKGIFMTRSRLVNTIKYVTSDGIIINLSVKKFQDSVADVITHFDLSCIMIGQDIRTGAIMDLTGDKDHVTLNKFRELGMLYWEGAAWLRQWDRVVKYYSRGFNTLPAAKQYLSYVQRLINQGNPFDTESSSERYMQALEEFIIIRDKISNWIREKELQNG